MSDIDESTQFEERDLSLKAATTIAIATLLFLAFITIGSRFVIDYRIGQHRMMDRAPRPGLSDFDVTQAFPEPRLQISPRMDMEAYRAKERLRLASSGWVDRQGKIAHIPIELAMELYALRLQGRQSADDKEDGGVQKP